MQTVIAAFQDRAQAERAREQLVQRGFDRDDIHIEQPQTSATGTPATQDPRSQGRISGFFANLFGSDDDYERHGSTWNEAVHRGSSVIVVDAQDENRATEAASCLRDLGAMDIDEHASQWRAQGWTGATGTSSDTRGQRLRDDAPPVGKAGVVDVVQEELKVGKRHVDQGGVRVIQRVSSKPVREVVKLREERAVVDRRSVDRPADAGDMAAFKEGTLEVRESSEEAVVSKTARVVEEVRVSKDVREREQVVEDKLRRKDVDVERISGTERERAVAADRQVPRPPGGERAAGTAPSGTRKKGGGSSGPL